MIKKICHIIKTAEHITIVYNDYSATVVITYQISLNTIFIEKLNLWLVCVSEYLQQFCFDIQHKLSKLNIIFNALFRLVSHKYQFKFNKSSLNILHTGLTPIYTNTFIKILSDFWKWIIDRYDVKLCWVQIREIRQKNKTFKLNATALSCIIIRDLIYYKNIKCKYCFSLLTSLYQKVFALTYDTIRHSEYICTHKQLTNSFIFISFQNTCISTFVTAFSVSLYRHSVINFTAQCSLFWHHLICFTF